LTYTISNRIIKDIVVKGLERGTLQSEGIQDSGAVPEWSTRSTYIASHLK